MTAKQAKTLTIASLRSGRERIELRYARAAAVLKDLSRVEIGILRKIQSIRDPVPHVGRVTTDQHMRAAAEFSRRWCEHVRRREITVEP